MVAGGRLDLRPILTLEAIGLVDVEGPDEADDPTATRVYRLAERYRGVYESVASLSISLSREETREGMTGEQPTDSYTPEGA